MLSRFCCLPSQLADDSLQPKIKEIQIHLTGFLGKDAGMFCKELWDLCLSAQASPQGVPQKLLEEKKAELALQKASKPH